MREHRPFVAQLNVQPFRCAEEYLLATDDRPAFGYAAHLRPSLASSRRTDTMAATRTATVTWTGNLATGSGTVSAGSSDLFTDLPVSWTARTEQPDGQTSPEELLAAAHASCFSMQLSVGLDRAGTPPDHLHVSATVTFDKVGDAWTVTSSEIDVMGVVPGVDEAGFDAAVQAAKDGCPISRALAGNVALSATATLEEEHD
jgi:osmotically inducible protein OsmC